jgi:hypothetical protein
MVEDNQGMFDRTFRLKVDAMALDIVQKFDITNLNKQRLGPSVPSCFAAASATTQRASEPGWRRSTNGRMSTAKTMGREYQ